jgi:hypothetical protein
MNMLKDLHAFICELHRFQYSSGVEREVRYSNRKRRIQTSNRKRRIQTSEIGTVKATAMANIM